MFRDEDKAGMGDKTHLCLSAWGKGRTTLKAEVSLGNLARFCLRKIEVVESVTEGTT